MCINCAKKRAKSEVFGLFLDFGGSDRLDIAHDGSPKCFSTYDSGLRSCTINQVCIICIKLCKKEPKIRFQALFSNLEHRNDLILHLWIELNVVNDLARTSLMFSICIFSIINVEKSKKRFLTLVWPFSRVELIPST